MPKQIFQRPAPVKRDHFQKPGKAGGAPDLGRKPPKLPRTAKSAAVVSKSGDYSPFKG